jgi:serine protease
MGGASPQFRDRRPRPVVRDFDPPMPDVGLLTGYNARVLDPSTASVVSGQPAPRSTVYVGDRLLVSLRADVQQVVAILTAAGEGLGIGVYAEEPRAELQVEPDATSAGVEDSPAENETTQRSARDEVLGVLRLRLQPLPGVAVSTLDAFTLLQRARAQAGAAAVAAVGLDHLLFATPGIVGSPFHGPLRAAPFHGPLSVAEGGAISGYGDQGGGGRQPVAWLGPEPRHGSPKGRRPVVAVLDTGCGQHRWLTGIAITDCSLDGRLVGMPAPEPDPEVTGDVSGPLDGAIDAAAGHGTFIAGLVRQRCPEAEIVSVRVVHSDGVVIESDLIDALTAIGEIAQRHAIGRGPESDARPIDVLNLSLGYYHETPTDELFDPTLYRLLEFLGRCGTVVVAAAGNDATSRPMYPAAFSPYPAGLVKEPVKGCVPVVSVGAENPDRTVALFSNCGPWVHMWALGAAVVSTIPETFNGGAQPAARTRASGQDRSALDPDGYTQGFAVWSGTSFSAPVIAGDVAAALLANSESGDAPLGDCAPHRAVPRALRALARVVEQSDHP